MTISTERVRQYATDEFMFAADDVRAMAAELLAVREAKPVASTTKSNIDAVLSGVSTVIWPVRCFKGEIRVDLYTAPPAPAVPADVAAALDWIDDFIARCNGDDRGACNSVNVLRAAMLQPVSQGYTFDGLNIRAVAALRESVRNQWLKSEELADKVYWQNMHSIANEIIEAMAAAPTPTKAVNNGTD
ncbi:hypothetical protein ABQ333_04875 [Serratia fonticola]|uniref:hypothetical protein n=1 Tax=Serratia fonticola TaxID=47917 RepID=UPI003AAC92D2